MLITAETFHKAIGFATQAHKEQYRKGDGRPYILHPIEVMVLAMNLKKSVNTFLIGIVCMLHDTAEDCEEVTLEIIAKEFGYAVAALVDELTLNKEEYKTIGKTECLKRHTIAMSSYALFIKLCDRYCNIKDMVSMNEVFRTRYIAETREILENLESRKLTKTHRKLINMIYKQCKQWES